MCWVFEFAAGERYFFSNSYQIYKLKCLHWRLLDNYVGIAAAVKCDETISYSILGVQYSSKGCEGADKIKAGIVSLFTRKSYSA